VHLSRWYKGKGVLLVTSSLGPAF